MVTLFIYLFSIEQPEKCPTKWKNLIPWFGFFGDSFVYLNAQLVPLVVCSRPRLLLPVVQVVVAGAAVVEVADALVEEEKKKKKKERKESAL